MDRERFDALARLLATTGSRRVAFGALLGAGLAGTGLETKARKDKERKGRKRKDKTRKGKGRQKVRSEAASCCSDSLCTPGKGKNLKKCCYVDDDVSGRNFSGANLSKASFIDTDATDADFRRANLGNACFVDSDITGARVDDSTNLDGAIFCRTQTETGENNSGCDLGTPCCPTCDEDHPCDDGDVCCRGRCIPGNCCDNGEQSTCGQDSICCDNTCREGDCCAAADCPNLTCQRRRCQDNQCTYTAVLGETGPRCPNQRICCQDAQGNPVCCPAGDDICDAQDQCSCDALTCEDLPGQCGSAIPDGCGGTISCGCCAPQVCSGTAQGECVIQCGSNQCDPDTQKCCTNSGSPICIDYDRCCTFGALDVCLASTNASNTTNNFPHVELVGTTANSVTLRFHRGALDVVQFFEYRIDDEIRTCGTPHQVITGDWQYRGVCLGGPPCPDGPVEMTFTANEQVQVRLALGAENDWYFESNQSSWVTFNVGA
jgi:hypothetical protein